MKSAYRLTGLSLVINKYRGYFLSNGDMQIQVNRMEGNMRNSTVMASVIFMVAGLQGCQDIFDKNTSQVPSEIGALVNEASSETTTPSTSRSRTSTIARPIKVPDVANSA